MARSFLAADLTIDHEAIEAAARAAADAVMANPRLSRFTTWEIERGDAHARYLDIAEGHRSTELWRQQRAAALAAMTPRERHILELRETAHLAPMIDDTAEAIAVQEAAAAELAKLMAEAV